ARRSVPSKVTSTKRFARQLQISRPNTNLRSVSQITYRGAIALDWAAFADSDTTGFDLHDPATLVEFQFFQTPFQMFPNLLHLFRSGTLGRFPIHADQQRSLGLPQPKFVAFAAGRFQFGRFHRNPLGYEDAVGRHANRQEAVK
ncbi:hypothetical protein, partial [Rubripirellula obstinata]|uniref:hypothetical protein n=1 Tax=Rubripirellula obstinata TaxID=406547 RepID=UPI001EE3C62F